MVDEVEKPLSPKKRAKKELEDAFVAALDKIKESTPIEEWITDQHVDDTKLEPELDLNESEINEIESEKITLETEEELTESEKIEISKKLTLLRGIGQKTAEKLVEFSITSIEDIATLEVDMIPESLDIPTRSLRTAIKNARKHLEKDKQEEEPIMGEEITPDLQEETFVEVMGEVFQKEVANEPSVLELNNNSEVKEPSVRPFRDKDSIEMAKSDWKAEIDQFSESIKDDIRFFYDEMTRFHDIISEMRSNFQELRKEVNQIDEKVSELLIQKVKSEIDTAKTKIVELQKDDFSKTVSMETVSAAKSKVENVIPENPTKVKVKSKSSKKPKKVRKKISLDELTRRLNAVGLIRGTNESSYTICEILVEQDTQEMNYDALFIRSQLPPQTFSQIIFDLSTKKIIDFDSKTDIVSLRTSK
jgi:predicted flap endonuclease-1-like 5' DNA nuclease